MYGEPNCFNFLYIRKTISKKLFIYFHFKKQKFKAKEKYNLPEEKKQFI